MTPVLSQGYDSSMKFGQRGLDAYKAQTRLVQREQKEDSPGNSALKALEKQERNELDITEKNTRKGFLKTGKKAEEAVNSSLLPEEMKGIRKAARFILLLGREEAGKVLREMDEKEIELITAEIAHIRSVSLDEASRILEDFGSSLTPHSVSGGVDMAREILNRAFGKEKSREVIHRAVPDAVPPPFSFMNDLTVPQTLQVLKGESIETLAIILSFMEAPRASGFIKTLPPDEQIRLIKRMGRLQKIDPLIVSSIDNLLQERVHAISKVEDVEIDGAARLTEILRHMSPIEENHILHGLEDRNPDLSRRIREELMTMDCIFQLRPRDLQSLLLEIPNETLVLLLKDKDDKVVNHILDHLSTQRRSILEEERILAPLVPRRDVQEVTRTFLETIRSRQEEGSYILLDEEDEYLV